MAKTALLILLSLDYISMTSCASVCNSNGPENCTFYTQSWTSKNGYHTSCSWSLGDNFTLAYATSDSGLYYFVGLNTGVSKGKLESRLACSTQGQTHCLRFWYLFTYNNRIDLSVMVKYEGSNQAQSPMLTVSSSNIWEEAALPITTTRDFRIIFRAKRRFKHWSSLQTVAIDDISYSKSPCQSGLSPARAQPTTTTISTTPAKTTKPTRSTMSSSSTSPKTTQTALTTVQRGTTYVNPRPVSSSTPSESADTTVQGLTVSESNDITAEKAGSDEVGLIVGVIVAVLIVIIAVIAVLLVVFRRKHLHLLKACWGKKQPKEQFHMNASDNAAYSLDADDHVMNHTQQNSVNDRREARASSRSPTNHVYANSPSEAPSQPVYAMVNKPGKAKQENTPQSRGKPDTTIYELCNEDAMSCPLATGAEYQNLPPMTSEQEQGGPSNDSNPVQTVSNGYSVAQPQNANSVYHILEKDSEAESRSVYHVPNTTSTASSRGLDTEYNRLNFNQKGDAEAENSDGQKSGAEAELENCDQKRSEKAAGGVYNHLNEGSGDTYSEVHREKKAGVIDGVYSHI